jgi:hypothetical protein
MKYIVCHRRLRQQNFLEMRPAKNWCSLTTQQLVFDIFVTILLG